jgi:hypothetical protein
VAIDNETRAQDSILCILIAMDVQISLMAQEGEVGAIGTTDKVAMGYYLVKWLSEAYTLQAETQDQWWWTRCILTVLSVYHIGTHSQGRQQLLR